MRTTTSPARSALVALLGRPGVRPRDIANEILERDDPKVCLELLARNLRESEGLFADNQFGALLEQTRLQIDEWEAKGIGVHACFEDSYPSQLRDIREMPLVVFTRGKLAADDRAIAVVGTRDVSEQGLRRTRKIVDMLTERSITTVSGLALGVDTAAHRAALDAGGRTVAVIANGVDHYYPKANFALQDEIADHGLVISSYLPGLRPQKWQFLERNAVMSGYAAATIVVEAGERSGTRTQVARALEHGRPVILLEEVLTVSWAKEAAERPGVHIATNPAQLESILDELFAQRAAFDNLPPVTFPSVV